MDPRLLDLLAHTLVIRPVLSATNTGTPTYGPAIRVSARVSRPARNRSYTDHGAASPPSWQVYFEALPTGVTETQLMGARVSADPFFEERRVAGVNHWWNEDGLTIDHWRIDVT